MNRIAYVLVALVTLQATSSCDLKLGSKNSTKETAPTSGLTQRPSNPDCVAGKRPTVGTGAATLSRVFPNLSFNQPVAMVQPPGDSSRWYVVEKSGHSFSFPNSDSAAVGDVIEFLDLSGIVDAQSEGGFLGLTFHPDFSNNHFAYASYTTSDAGGGNFRSVISRFTVDPQTHSASTGSEHTLLTIAQPYGNHDGGNIAFGPDGFLYIGFGDGGNRDDQENHGQDTRTLLGAMLRIDVNASAAQEANGQRYVIPAGNPFPGSPSCSNGSCPNQAFKSSAQRCSGDGCPELFAWGLRNPWRWSFDRLTGDLWVGDVGQDAWEEIDLVQLGKNYGWNCFEGSHSYSTSGNCPSLTTAIPPINEYDHSVGYAITGGYVYRGAAIPALTGVYLFADFGSGTIFGLSDPKGSPVRAELTSPMGGIASFAQDHEGEVYAINLYNGQIFKFVPGATTTTPGFPAKLSDTGCADAANPTLPRAGMIPYDVVSPLWSDGAIKKRYLALPNQEQITIATDNDWTLPPGSVLRKDFYLQGALIETRLLAHHTDGDWAGYSYEWNADHTDATLITDSKTVAIGNQAWYYPNGSDCLQCHSLAAGRTLGPKTSQLNRNFLYTATGITANQIDTYSAIDLFSNPPGSPSNSLIALADPQSDSATLEQRAKSYLDANCSHCHRPGGPGRGVADFRYETAFIAMNLCNQDPTDDLGIAGAKLFVPGNTDLSLIAVRIKDTGNHRMPPLATSVPDTNGIQLIDAWINSRQSCS